jgi:hypothetical protein
MRTRKRCVVLGIALLTVPTFSRGEETCQPLPGPPLTPPGRACRAEVNFGTFSAKYDPQYQSQWCWAACISMLFRYYKHPVSQSRIVSEVYGAPVNLPAGAGFIVAQQLNRSWQDDLGGKFRSRLTAAFDADAGVVTLNNARIIDSLRRGRPLIVGAGGHAVVLTAVEYLDTAFGIQIQRGGVFDPWPGVGPRGLSPAELVPVPFGSLRFMAEARITDE